VPCQDRESTCQMPRKASRVPKIFPSRKSSNVAAAFVDNLVQRAGIAPIGIATQSACCTTWETWSRVAHTISISPTRFIIAHNVTSTLTRTCRTWRYRRATIPTAWCRWRFAWPLKMVCPTGLPVGTSGVTIACLSLGPRFRTGSRLGGKKAEARIETDYLDWALDDFSGYIAVDELYDGPYCVLSIVDNRTFKRITYRVLDHDPTHDDIREFFTAFRDALNLRGLVLHGITTDASPLYPGPISAIFPGVRHQVCEFHVIAEITKAVLHAGAAFSPGRKNPQQVILSQSGKNADLPRRLAASGNLQCR
jgi:hypothetical protein